MQIPIIRRGGAGSSSSGLNLTIVSGTTQPENPKENTIWINYGGEITSWCFDILEPNPQEGLVWFNLNRTGAPAINIINENTIMLRVNETYVYESEAWVPVEASIYQLGEWVPIKTPEYYLLKEGEGALVPLSTNDGVSYLNESGAYFNQNEAGKVMSSNKIDLTKYSTFCVEAKISSVGSSSSWKGSLIVSNSNTYEPSNSVARTVLGTENVRTVYTLDISAYSSEYHIGVAGNAKGYVYNMWLE